MLHGIVSGMPIIVHKCPTQYQECLYTIVMQSAITAIGQVAERLGTRLACTGILLVSLTYIGPLVDVTCLMREHTFSESIISNYIFIPIFAHGIARNVVSTPCMRKQVINCSR